MADREGFHQFHKFHKNPLIDLLYNERLRRILDMLNLGANKTSIVLDIGCGKGYFSRVLSLQSMTIGLDVSKRAIVEAQVQERVNKSDRGHLIVADICSLPFRSHSIDAVVCASVLEHIANLEGATRQIKDVLREDGILVAGYPIETRFFKLIWRVISPWSYKFIDQSQTFWYNPSTHKQECYWESPSTHKQDYRTIREVLRKHFRIVERVKLPITKFLDSLSYYECLKCVP